MTRASLFLLISLAATSASAQSSDPAQPPAPGPESDQTVLLRSVLEAVRANTQAVQKTDAALETLANRLERVEAATRSVPPSIEGVRPDVIAIRATLERLAMSPGIRGGAATLRFGPFACGNESVASCAVNACKSIGYRNGLAIASQMTGTGAAAKPASVSEATCFD